MADSPLRHDLTREKLAVVDGYIEVPPGPGLGVTVDLETVAKYRVG
jgi:L-alanine-DL-glutamate epimerase-like enolase superfamily enzyme